MWLPIHGRRGWPNAPPLAQKSHSCRLDTLGLGAALHVYIENWSQEIDIETKFDFEEDAFLGDLPSEQPALPRRLYSELWHARTR